MTCGREHRRERDHERGSMSIFVVVFSVVVFLLAGLLVDGGAAINARLRANDVAEQAARAAADVIDQEHLRETGEARLLDEGPVCEQADEIVDAHEDDAMERTRCEVGNGQTEVTVGVSVRWEAFFLAALGFAGTEMEGSATAGPDIGEEAD
ncbi:pilus assembly protein TadG-related protein [Spongiactinospora sp. TRM90649]|uniref:pilus assembly protein TadG-related protein n=1 Tax=Spongiactinospora sp. TRM90649 TaxID=3031114 RepID=UPI0023F9AFEC|nr:pilus assembly protein TadG-related protein [Spongiactinospora sp. TRM90649]MDF5751262.1 pilus assembly protein TadG-related protein [Spongiactinospora sp. TRM90649]